MLKPHLATDADITLIKFPVFVQPKIDGVRGIHLPNTGFTARTLKRFKNRRLTAKFGQPELAGFDGELTYTNQLTADDLCRTTTSLVNTIDGPDTAVWNIFDYITPETVNKPYKDRYWIMHEKVHNLVKTHSVWENVLNVVPYVQINDQQTLDIVLRNYLECGYEGIIIRKINGLHKDGRCTQREGNFLRIKDFATEEAKIIKLLEAEENLNTPKLNELGFQTRSSHKENLAGKGMIGTLVCWSQKWGVFNVGPGRMTHDDRIKFWNNPELILDKVCTFKYLKTGTLKAPRMATFQHFRASEDIL